MESHKTEPKLRLVLFKECKRRCRGCCNKDWDLAALPVCEDYRPYRKILLTGGEPMLYPSIVETAIAEIRAQTQSPIVLYTAKTDEPARFLSILGRIEGMTVTLHTRADLAPFRRLRAAMQGKDFSAKALRLNVFKGVLVPRDLPTFWQVKSGITWIPNAPLPQGEALMRYRMFDAVCGLR